MTTFVGYTPIDHNEYEPALGCSTMQLTASDVESTVIKAYRADSDSLPFGYEGAGGRVRDSLPNMYLITFVGDHGMLSMFGSRKAPKWLESLCDKCEAEIAEDEL